jgi:hypothetical protein
VSYLFLIYKRFSLLQLVLYFLVENNIRSLLLVNVQKRENFTEKIKRCTIYSKTYVQSMAVHYTLSWSPLLTAVRTSVVQCVRLESPPVRYAGSPMDQCPESNSCAHVWMLRNEAVLLCPIADDYFISIACDVHFFLRKDHFVITES